jgi:ketosteroid isomerase-like protein
VTADIWHLRDGKIWRHFADFEVYVDGNLIEM